MPAIHHLILLIGFCAIRHTLAGLVAFGDSYTDAGEGSRYFGEYLNTSKVYPPTPFADGVFSNGPPFIRRTATLLNQPLEDYAVGGATAGAVYGILGLPAYVPELIPVPSVVEQVTDYLASVGGAEPISSDAVHVIWAGSNDYLDTYAFSTSLPSNGSELVEAVISNISAAVSMLIDGGADRFVLVNLPPLQSLPAVSQAAMGSRAKDVQAALEPLVTQHNARLVGLASELILQKHRTAVFDVYGIFQSIQVTGATAYSITQTQQPCFNSTAGTLCSDPDRHLFFDILHPTERVHTLIGELLAGELAI